jgi:hypothetical protein
MDRKDAQMQKFLPALALSLAVQTAMAANQPASHDAAAPLAGGLMHASLVVPAQAAAGPQHAADPAALTANLQAGDEAAARKESQGREHTTGMLVAALALMVGIVLRRWGTDHP